jgi:SAM-dependent methyltransferase
VSNYHYMIEAARRLSRASNPKVLDFGAGLGELVALGHKAGLDIQGIDTYADHYDTWQSLVPAEIRDRVHKVDGPLPFPDSSFDVVVSNQVFEHIPHPPSVLPEIRRVLKPGGAFLAIFPVRETWYEGHVGLYFAHRLQRFPRAQQAYLELGHRLGFGLYRGKGSRAWARYEGGVLQSVCFYHRMRDIERWWREAFETPPVSLAADFVAYRLKGSRAIAVVPGPLRNLLLRAIARARAGVVLAVRKPETAAAESAGL